ncbi:MAG: hypothetical protein PHC61_18290 [Chitinivibrionales bacterium]|nr:hypothetical protein [Chitinivibrionales bacterium]
MSANFNNGFPHLGHIPGSLGILLAVACLIGTPRLSAQEETGHPVLLKSIEPLKMPVIKHNTFYYYIDLNFSTAPTFFWVFYDSLNKSLILDCYDVTVKLPGKLILHHPLFESIAVKTLPTKMSLLGEQSQIILGLERGWNCSASLQSETAIRIIVWKEINIVQIEHRSKLILWLVATSALIGALAYIVFLLSKS